LLHILETLGHFCKNNFEFKLMQFDSHAKFLDEFMRRNLMKIIHKFVKFACTRKLCVNNYHIIKKLLTFGCTVVIKTYKMQLETGGGGVFSCFLGRGKRSIPWNRIGKRSIPPLNPIVKRSTPINPIGKRSTPLNPNRKTKHPYELI